MSTEILYIGGPADGHVRLLPDEEDRAFMDTVATRNDGDEPGIINHFYRRVNRALTGRQITVYMGTSKAATTEPKIHTTTQAGYLNAPLFMAALMREVIDAGADERTIQVRAEYSPELSMAVIEVRGWQPAPYTATPAHQGEPR